MGIGVHKTQDEGLVGFHVDPSVTKPPLRKKKLDALGRAYATGKRKESIARVWVRPGSGNVVVNKKPYVDYFRMPRLLFTVLRPFEVIGRVDSFDVFASAKGGGICSQATALSLGISKALVIYDSQMRPELKRAKLLTRDSRVVERKKYGHKKARKSFQYSKR